MRAADNPSPKTQILGVGLDNTDGHTRITRGKNFHLIGGSQDTHAHMQETCIKINEHLDRKGKKLEHTTPQELHDIVNKVKDDIGQPPN